MPPKRQVTLAHVAEAAGVSIATASRAINGSTRHVSSEMVAKVSATAEKLGYLPNLSAQTVVKGASPTVAILVSDIADPYFSTISSGIMGAAREAGLMITVATSERRPSDELDIIRTFRSQRPRAIILAGSRQDPEPQAAAIRKNLEAYRDAGGHVVMISQGPSPFSLVEIENEQGAHQLANALVDQGGMQFGVVVGHRHLRTNADRLRGFTQGLTERGMTVDPAAIAEAPFTRDGGYQGMRELLARGLSLDTVFVTSDLMAFGAATALREAGLEPGKDVSLAGFDDIGLTQDVTPALSTVHVPLSFVGRQAMELALSADEHPQCVSVPTTVVLRASTPRR